MYLQLQTYFAHPCIYILFVPQVYRSLQPISRLSEELFTFFLVVGDAVLSPISAKKTKTNKKQTIVL